MSKDIDRFYDICEERKLTITCSDTSKVALQLLANVWNIDLDTEDNAIISVGRCPVETARNEEMDTKYAARKAEREAAEKEAA